MDNLQAVIDAARQTIPAVKVEEGPTRAVYFVPGNSDVAGKLEQVPLDLLAPARKTGNVSVFDAASFNEILAQNIDAGNITVYVNRDARQPAIVGVLNGNGAKGPGFGDFRAAINFRVTPQWEKWTKISGTFMSQADFAHFIEDNILDVRSPAAADMLEISQALEVTKTTAFKSITRPRTGQVVFKNEEAMQENVTVPETISLFIAPLFGMPPMEITARFRYRIEGGNLRLGVKLQRVEEIMAHLVDGIASAIVLPAGAVQVEGIAP